MAALFIVVTFATMAWQRRVDLLLERQTSNERLAETLAEHVEGVFQQSTLVLATISERLSHEGGAKPGDPDFHAFLATLARQAPEIAAMRVLSPDGRYLHSYPEHPDETVNAADRDYVAVHATPRQGLFLGPPIVSRINGLLVLPVSIAHRKPDGTVAAVVVALIRIDRLNTLFDTVRSRPNGTVALFRADGILLGRGPFSDAMGGQDFSDGPLFKTHLPASPHGSYTSVVATDQRLRQASYRTLDGLPLVVSVSGLHDDAMAVWHQYLAALTAIGLPLVMVAAAVTLLLHRQLRERERFERLLARRTADLELANEELRHVAEISAHHLQEPLRTVLSYGQLLIRAAQGKDGGSLDEYLGFVRAGIDRMKGQLDSLQRYLGMEQCRPHQTVSLTRLMSETLERLGPELERCGGVVVVVGSLPEIRGDRQHLASLFHHLLTAIMGLHRPDTRQTIRFGAEREDDMWHLRVEADNTDINFGDGETSFPVLDSGSVGPHGGGPTLSLALCRKIVHLHGGHMWAETLESGESRLHLFLPGM
ncbi:MAG: hypothetical protein HY055_13770 [Magnetospirillum sp.]|nr:hypothetical protein [Magnetospirillum sp.]